ncbi:MAG: SDR family oxidoreductase [Verrucomicrobia bacterium]|nr:SDR family oxidoreductase [Verrucomicrobiota bacterium]
MERLAWITGTGGLIGNQLVLLAARHALDVKACGITRTEIDLTDFAAVTRAFREQSPALVIHCAAMSKSPACQANPEAARKANVAATQCLAELAAEIPFVFFSTDLVFDGRKGNYVETDAVKPLSIYAETKVAAEQIVLRNPRHLVVRTSLNYGTSPSGTSAFNEEMAAALRAGRPLNLFADEYRSPIPAVVTARAVWELVSKNATGLFHVAGAERLSRFRIGELVAEKHPELNPRLIPGSRHDYQGAPRPPDTSFNCMKAQALLSFRLPKFSEWLAGEKGRKVAEEN